MGSAVVATEVQAMFGSIAGRYDLTNSVLSFGIHHLWRRALLNLMPASGDLLALDLCTGTGDLLRPLKRRCRSVVGLDFCWPMLKAGADKRRARKEESPPLIQGDALRLPFKDATFDVVTVAFGVRNLEKLDQGLTDIRRILKPGGSLLVLEFGQPRGIFGALYRFYSTVVMPFVGGMITGNRAAYTYLPETAKRFPCGPEFLKILTANGYGPVSAKPLTGGIAYAYRAINSQTHSQS